MAWRTTQIERVNVLHVAPSLVSQSHLSVIVLIVEFCVYLLRLAAHICVVHIVQCVLLHDATPLLYRMGL